MLKNIFSPSFFIKVQFYSPVWNIYFLKCVRNDVYTILSFEKLGTKIEFLSKNEGLKIFDFKK